MWLAAAAPAAELRVAVFRADATPDPGEPLIWITPAAKVEDPLWAKGVIIEGGGGRYVLCAVDWCGIGGGLHRFFRDRIAKAAGTDAARVVVQTVHQHTAPYADGGGYQFLGKVPSPPLRMSGAYLDRLAARLAQAVREARFVAFDAVGTGAAAVEQTASARRVFENSKLLVRYSTGGKDPHMAALPEGAIDTHIKTVTLAAGKRPLARIHFYATHPQTFCCDGRVSSDFVGAARERFEIAEGVFQLYFTGCAGDVTVGKYNDGSDAARERLAANLERGMRDAASATHLAPAANPVWRTAPLRLTPKPAPEFPAKRSGQDLYRAAISAAFAARKAPLDTASLELGPARMVFLPGEPMLEFQRYAQGARGFIAVAGYGDLSPGYLVTDRAYREGGYEPSASNAAPGTEARVKQVIDQLLGRKAR
ncbi:MAG: hypothetical protein ACE15B_02230 [Bryobacteraceae bacterium]